jgi:hypothetical protein
MPLGFAGFGNHGQLCGVPVPPVHSPPGSGAWLPDLNVSTNVFNRGSLAESSFICAPQTEATIGDGRPG